ncbi:hypothetical protein ACFV0Y_16640 [Streptomyces sp. NPDC059569]|uniref:hypothetical protein n=1 Tax=Streptomyces sp. NPDC059569 TaxID=3346869 RepID=UPI0036C2123F
MFSRNADARAVQAARDLKAAVVDAGVFTDPADMTDADIARVAHAAQVTRDAVDAAGGDLRGAIARAR